MTDPNGAAILMVCHGSHQQKPPINVSINLPAPAGSVMGIRKLRNSQIFHIQLLRYIFPPIFTTGRFVSRSSLEWSTPGRFESPSDLFRPMTGWKTHKKMCRRRHVQKKHRPNANQ